MNTQIWWLLIPITLTELIHSKSIVIYCKEINEMDVCVNGKSEALISSRKDLHLGFTKLDCPVEMIYLISHILIE